MDASAFLVTSGLDMCILSFEVLTLILQKVTEPSTTHPMNSNNVFWKLSSLTLTVQTTTFKPNQFVTRL